jgi:hypothetical protein
VARPGDIVWHGHWDEFAPLFHWNPDVRYIIGMDPWYLLAHDPRMALTIARCTDANYADDEELRDVLTVGFGARFALLWRMKQYGPLEDKLRTVSWAKLIHDDRHAVVFELTRR